MKSLFASVFAVALLAACASTDYRKEHFPAPDIIAGSRVTPPAAAGDHATQVGLNTVKPDFLASR